MQEGGAFQAHVDERGLHAGQHALHAALVEIAHDAAPALPLDEQLGQHAVLDERGAVFARRHVDQDFRRHPLPRFNLSFHTGIPARRSISAVSNSGSPIDARVAAGDVLDEHRAESLDGVRAGLALRFTALPVRVDLRARECREAHLRGRDSPCRTAAAYTRQPVWTSCSRPESMPSMRDASASRLGFAEDLAVDDHGGIGGEHRQIAGDGRRSAAAFSRASRRTYCAGVSLARGVSSMSAGVTTCGTPISV